MAEILKKTTFKGTWLGKAGVSTTYHLDKKRDGLRVVVLALEGQPISIDLIKGDGRFSDGRFQKIESSVVGLDEIDATVEKFVRSA